MRMGKGMWKFFEGRNLTRWSTSSIPFVLLRFKTSLHPLNIMLVLKAPSITYFSNWKVLMIISKIVISLNKWLGKKLYLFKMSQVNAWYSGSKVAKNTFLINPYKIFLNDSNGHGCWFLNINILIFSNSTCSITYKPSQIYVKIGI